MSKQEPSIILGRRIAALRRKASLTQAQLAERAGIHYVHLARIETGVVWPSAKMLEKVAEGLQEPVKKILAVPVDSE